MIKDCRIKILKITLFLLLCSIPIFPQTLDFKGLISSWGVGSFQKSANPQLGVRFIPELFLEKSLSDNITLDANVSLNAYGVATFEEIDDVRSEGDIKPYRLWARFSSSQFEIRLGLQKISFGSAALLRPLMWFDRLDPRDPLQLTEGADLNQGPFEGLFPLNNLVPENRYGIDGKWDISIGVWAEATWTHQESDLLLYPWQRVINAGLDYTFDIGNGLYLLGEHLFLSQAQDAWSSGEDTNFSSFLLRYPLSIMDDLTAILYYDWENREFYRFINWQRTTDNWMFNVIGFWNPDEFNLYPTQAGNNPFVGKGFQIMATFNF